MKNKQGWKVVKPRTIDGVERLRSAYGSYMPRAVNYRADRFVKPRTNCGPLAVFTSLSAAQLFAGHMSQFQIWECEYEPSRGGSLFYKENLGTALRPFWYKKAKTLDDLPYGSALARKVKLLRRVQ